MKKVSVLLLCALLLTCLLTECGPIGVYAAQAKQEPVKLIFWGGLPPESGPQQLIDNYKLVEPNVTIEYVRYVNNDQGNIKLDTALMAGEEIDIFTSYGVDRREQRVNAGMAADITDLCKKYDIDLIRDFGPGAQPNIVDGKVYSIPTMTIINFIAVNKDMFDASGLPVPTDWTLEEFRDIAKKLTKGEGQNKVYGIIGDQNVNIMSFLPTKLNGTPYLNKNLDGTTWKAIPDFRKGFQLLYDMMYVDQSMMSWEDILTEKLTNTEALASAFFNGRSAMMVTGTYMLRNIKDTKQYPRNFTVAFAPKPKVDKDQTIYYKDQMPHDDMMIPPKSTKKDEAVKFLKWYATQGYDPMIENGRLPLYKGYDSSKVAGLLLKGADDVLDVKSFAENVLTPSDYIKEDRTVRQAAELAAILREEQEAFYLNVIDIDTLLNNLHTRMDNVLKANK